MQPIQKIAPGAVIHRRYEVIKTLGFGAVGTVVLAADRELDDQRLVLKILHGHLAAEPNTVKRFNAEAMLGRQISHPNVARLYDVVSEGDFHFLTMEYVEGCSLEELLLGATNRRLPWDEALHLLLQVLSALVAAHAQEVTHRDLKPANILVDRSGCAKLVDFGLAKGVESAHGLTRTGELIGTPRYMAPEQFANLADQRSDFYAWAIVAYEMICGKAPFVAESSIALMQKHRLEPYPYEDLIAAGCPDWFAQILRSCAEKDPANRPHSARHILTEIQQRYTPAAPGQVQRALVHVVKRSQRSHHLLNNSARFWIRLLWIGVVLVGTGGMLHERMYRQRTAMGVVQISKLTGISAAPFLSLLGFGKYSELRNEDLVAAISENNIYAARVLLSAGVGPNVTDADGLPVYHQTFSGNPYVIESLCASKANTEAVSPNGSTALLEAIRRGLRGHAHYLLACNASLLARDRFGNTPLLLVVAQGDPLLLELLGRNKLALYQTQNSRSADGLPAIHLAIERSHWAIAKELLSMGFDTEVRDGEGRTVLMRLVAMRRTAEAAELFRLLLKRGADVRARDYAGRTLLDHATGEWTAAVAAIAQ